MGTGAFSSVSADRSVSISTANDSNALLAFQSNSNTNSEYVNIDGNGGKVEITTSNNDANGLNADSLTRILDMVDVVNQGTQAAVVYVDGDSIPNNKRTTSSGFGVDPQVTNRPNGDYNPENDLPADNPGANLQGEVSLTGIYNLPDFNSYAAEKGDFVLEPGESFSLGLYIKNPGDADIDVSMTMVADTSIVPDSYVGKGD